MLHVSCSTFVLLLSFPEKIDRPGRFFSDLKGSTHRRGQMPLCGFLRLPAVSAVSCENLRLPEVGRCPSAVLRVARGRALI